MNIQFQIDQLCVLLKIAFEGVSDLTTGEMEALLSLAYDLTAPITRAVEELAKRNDI
ncbi:hypothetical protein PWV40_004490 [Salmonella enterica]|uniref:Uncharacterized protein n=1 Tax=Salmonella enterica TaxID=28901 RepID=A0A743HPS2_SALER|nr:hypothetical protein [Salmonella enterica]HAF1793499.1 hypothetical protein [Salmonella enterica]